MLSNYVTALIRTLAALLAGWLLSLPLAHPVLVLLGYTDASPATKEKLVAALTVVLTAVYFAVGHALEKRWPAASLLFGSTRQPVVYAPTPDGTPVITSLGFTPAPGVLPSDLDPNTAAQPGAVQWKAQHAAPSADGG
jgi:uncharacterized protein YbjT (DUF2867 family)